MTKTKVYPTLTTAIVDIHDDDDDIRHHIYIITPAFAKLVLADRNPQNRNMAHGKLNQLVHDVDDGRFALNGETIQFDKNGQLINGQHRLTASVKTNKPFTSLVVMGLEPEIRNTIDLGRSRTAGDMLTVAGHKNGNVASSIARWTMAYEHGDGTYFAHPSEFSVPEIRERVENDEHLRDVAAWAVHHNGNIKGYFSASQLGTARMILETVYGQHAVDFLDQAATGVNCGPKHPALAVRKRLMGIKVQHNIAVEVIMRGYLAYRNGREVKYTTQIGVLPKINRTDRGIKLKRSAEIAAMQAEMFASTAMSPEGTMASPVA